jgi:hypothetical protein
MSKRLHFLAAFLMLACSTLILPARAAVLVHLDEIEPEGIQVAGFVLESEQQVEVEAVGFRYPNRLNRSDVSPAWILDAETRATVWSARRGDSKRLSKRLHPYEDKVDLPAGRYEVYYASYPHPWDGWRISGVGELITKIFTDDDHGDDDWDQRKFDRACREFFVKVSGEGRSLTESDIMADHAELRSAALVSSVRLEADQHQTRSIELAGEVELEIYAVGEAERDGVYDGSWIIDTETRERVWALDYRHSKRAGGAKKNRASRSIVKLPAGSYVLYTVTDDSHHFGRWNSAPPQDPYFWGVTIQTADPAAAKQVKIAEYENIRADEVVVELVRLRDGDRESQGFTLKRDMRLRVYAIGEGEEGDLADMSWIVDADSRETVWDMNDSRTSHAGGAKKNRLVDEMIELPAGNYIAFAATDGSHAYRDWNAGAPHDKRRWGFTLTAPGGKGGDVGDYDAQDDPSLLAEILGVGNRKYKHKGFTLERDGKVRIHALGEGKRGDMYDYAWIEDDRDRVVWEMTYRNTEHAGGARKNRLFHDTVSLEAGEYTVHYRSDGSHSFAGWNADPPRDSWSWGVTVRAAK